MYIQELKGVAKTFYLYGQGTEHTTPLAITLKQGEAAVATASLPHDKAETTEDVRGFVCVRVLASYRGLCMRGDFCAGGWPVRSSSTRPR